ncbi:hypothetical protein C7444_11337 [Sphaerotilus hippei]|uniref:Uncharacterized protein n=1 Tax=Sphaerotilus hippei TaxID=744406 RepID=A0A318GYK5_9BURK|nr:hypothetical protein [Sphaerotilus hippei]PXW94546.1 hypothetical protein C7444_11337 [Sphaerotilus hippei]
MRELKSNELQAVSGGTFCLTGGLFKSIFSLFSFKSSSYCAPAPAPAPAPCQPAPAPTCR